MADHQREVQARIHGRVQGVGFRMWARDEAIGLGLTGWVRNEADGSVTALIAGREDSVATMIERLWKGPAYARVSQVVVDDVPPGSTHSEFRITK